MDAWSHSLMVCVLLGLSLAWTQGLKKKSYEVGNFPFPWALARRSAYVPCSFTGQPCETTSQCCDDNDVCLTSVKYSVISGDKARMSTCQDMKEDVKYGKLASKLKLKASGQICSDSKQCADACCREVRGHRSRFYVCGTPEDDFMAYTCIQATRSGNDVLDDLL